MQKNLLTERFDSKLVRLKGNSGIPKEAIYIVSIPNWFD